MTAVALSQRWVFSRMKLTARNPRALVFTFAFPLILIVLFNALNGNAEVQNLGQDIRFAQFYTPAIAIFSLVSACYTTLVMGLAYARDDGLLKRVRGTPLPMAIYLGAWVTSAIVVGCLAVLLLFVVAVPVFDVHVYTSKLPEAIASLLMGALCLSALGVAVASLVKNAEQAQPVVQLTFLPLSFISGIWFPLDGAPDWLIHVAHFFPLYHIVNAFGSCFVPGQSGSAFNASDLTAMVIWTAVGLFVAVRRFRWEP